MGAAIFYSIIYTERYQILKKNLYSCLLLLGVNEALPNMCKCAVNLEIRQSMEQIIMRSVHI